MMDDKQINRSNSPNISKILLFLVIFVILAGCNIILTSSLQQHVFAKKKDSEGVEVRTVLPSLPLGSKQEEPREVRKKLQTVLTLSTGTRKEEEPEERQPFVPRNQSSDFHTTVLEFFDGGCDVKFFMIWISSVESFGSRENLAVESVFRVHPRACLTILSPTLDSPQGYLLLKQFYDRKLRILAVQPDLPFLLQDIHPAKAWLEAINSGKKSPGKVPLGQNLSNLMRLAVLYRYGGIYIDTDFIVLRSFEGMKNAIGAQSVDYRSKNWTRLNNAVLIFDSKHKLLREFIREFARSFNGNVWGHNGPYLVSRVVRRVEGLKGYHFSILPPTAFYPVDWIKIEKLFRTPKSNNESRWIKSKVIQLRHETYGLHLWNKISKAFRIEEGSVIQRLISY